MHPLWQKTEICTTRASLCACVGPCSPDYNKISPFPRDSRQLSFSSLMQLHCQRCTSLVTSASELRISRMKIRKGIYITRWISTAPAPEKSCGHTNMHGIAFRKPRHSMTKRLAKQNNALRILSFCDRGEKHMTMTIKRKTMDSGIQSISSSRSNSLPEEIPISANTTQFFQAPQYPAEFRNKTVTAV